MLWYLQRLLSGSGLSSHFVHSLSRHLSSFNWGFSSAFVENSSLSATARCHHSICCQEPQLSDWQLCFFSRILFFALVFYFLLLLNLYLLYKLWVCASNSTFHIVRIMSRWRSPRATSSKKSSSWWSSCLPDCTSPFSIRHRSHWPTSHWFDLETLLFMIPYHWFCSGSMETADCSG